MMTRASSPSQERRRALVGLIATQAFAYGTLTLFLLFLFLPILTVIIFSFNESRFLVWPPEGLTTHWYRAAWTDDQMREAFRNSILIGVATVSVSVPLGIAGAYLMTRTRVFAKAIWSTALVTPLVIPAVIVGVALLSFYQVLGVSTGLVTVLLAHTVLSVPYTSLVIAAQLQGFDRSIEEAARNLGASNVRTFVEITLPLLKPGIIAASLFAFLISFDEFLVTFFVIGTTDMTLPMKIYTNIRFGMTPEIHAVATVTTVISLVLLTMALMLSKMYRPEQ